MCLVYEWTINTRLSAVLLSNNNNNHSRNQSGFSIRASVKLLPKRVIDFGLVLRRAHHKQHPHQILLSTDYWYLDRFLLLVSYVLEWRLSFSHRQNHAFAWHPAYYGCRGSTSKYTPLNIECRTRSLARKYIIYMLYYTCIVYVDRIVYVDLAIMWHRHTESILYDGCLVDMQMWIEIHINLPTVVSTQKGTPRLHPFSVCFSDNMGIQIGPICNRLIGNMCTAKQSTTLTQGHALINSREVVKFLKVRQLLTMETCFTIFIVWSVFQPTSTSFRS